LQHVVYTREFANTYGTF